MDMLFLIDKTRKQKLKFPNKINFFAPLKITVGAATWLTEARTH